MAIAETLFGVAPHGTQATVERHLIAAYASHLQDLHERVVSLIGRGEALSRVQSGKHVDKRAHLSLNLSCEEGGQRQPFFAYDEMTPTLAVKLGIDLQHPFGQHVESGIDQRGRHLAIHGIGHGAGNGTERVGIAAKSYATAQAVDIAVRRKKADEGRGHGLLARLVKGVARLYVVVRERCPLGIITLKHILFHIVGTTSCL